MRAWGRRSTEGKGILEKEGVAGSRGRKTYMLGDIRQKSCIVMVLDETLGCDISYELSPQRSVFMTERKADDSFWRSIWQLFKLFIRYTLETVIAVGIFVVLLAASWITNCFNTNICEKVPEFVTVFKLLEFFLLAMGAILFVVFIVRNTVMLVKELKRDIFCPDKGNPDEGGNSK